MTEFIGKTIGNYRIEGLLGAGGMGQVFRARHIHLDRPAALKLLHGNLAQDPMFQTRFRQEAQAAAKLRHPHIVEVYDFDEYEGMAYLVMELVTGGSMRGWLRSAAQQTSGSLAQGLELVRQAADALAYAHAMGMVHRDIKPDNLLLQPGFAGRGPTTKVADFGLARMTEGSHLTATGMAMGTPAYMSPEQCQGKPLDGRSDIYALGVVLYEVATGTLPFVVKTVSEAVFKHVYVPAPSPRQVRPELPDIVEAIVLRCLAKLPEERFATAADLAAALSEALGAIAPDLAIGEDEGGAMLTDIAARTRIQTPRGGPAPVALTLMGGGSLPRVQVLDDTGTLLQVVAVRPGGLTVGRVERNDVVLSGEGVSRHHLRLEWDGIQVLATDLGSSNGTLLEERPLPPQEAVVWPWRTMLRVGSYWLRLDPPERAESGQVATPSGGALMTPQTVATPGGGVMTVPPLSGGSAPLPYSQAFMTTGLVGMTLEPETLAITPGQTATVAVTLANLSDQVDHLTVGVSGVPPEWVTLPPAAQMPPRGQTTVMLTVRPPAEPDARAGEYPVEITARSRARPAEGGSVLARWTVRPYVKEELTLSPTRARGRRRGVMKATVRNLGNAAVRYRLRGEADEAGVQVSLVPEELTIEAGASGNAVVTVEGGIKPFGSEAAWGMTVTATADHGGTLRASGMWLQGALLPVWSLIAALVLLGLGLAHGFGGLPASVAGGLPGYAILRSGEGVNADIAGQSGALPTPAATATQAPTAEPVAPVEPTVETGAATPTAETGAVITNDQATATAVAASGGNGANAGGGSGGDGSSGGGGGSGGAGDSGGSGGAGGAGGTGSTPTPTATATRTATPGATVAPTATSLPTSTPEPTNTLEPTATPEPTRTATALPANTPAPAEMPIPPTPTSTPTPTPTLTPTSMPTPTPMLTPTSTPTPTHTPTPTYTPTPTPTPTPTMAVPLHRAPPNGAVFIHFPRDTILQWAQVSGAVSYRVEIDCFHCCGWGVWCTDVGRTWRVESVPHIDGASFNEFRFSWVGAQPGRWRVSAIDANGREGPRHEWWYFEFRQ